MIKRCEYFTNSMFCLTQKLSATTIGTYVIEVMEKLNENRSSQIACCRFYHDYFRKYIHLSLFRPVAPLQFDHLSNLRVGLPLK